MKHDFIKVSLDVYDSKKLMQLKGVYFFAGPVDTGAAAILSSSA